VKEDLETGEGEEGEQASAKGKKGFITAKASMAKIHDDCDSGFEGGGLEQLEKGEQGQGTSYQSAGRADVVSSKDARLFHR